MNRDHQPGTSLVPLVHGGDWAGYIEQHPGALPLDFSANVSPLGVPPGIIRAITEAAAEADRYPDPLCRSLCRKIAEIEQVPQSFILCGNGAADLIFRAVAAVKPKQALIVAPTFAEYEAALMTAGCQITRHFLREQEDFRLGEDFLERIQPGIDMVFVCQPNNPTGITTPRELLLKIAQRCRDCGTMLMLDECFGDFLDQPQAYTMKERLKDFPGMVILKAFTKMYAMAGVRLGYALCCDNGFLQAMRQAGQPWAVSSLAQAAGEAALKESEYVDAVRQLVRKERPWMRRQLEEMGLRVIPGEANFLLFYCPFKLVQPLRERGILLRSCANYHGLDENWYRTAVRTHEENIRLIEAIREVLRG